MKFSLARKCNLSVAMRTRRRMVLRVGRCPVARVDGVRAARHGAARGLAAVGAARVAAAVPAGPAAAPAPPAASASQTSAYAHTQRRYVPVPLHHSFHLLFKCLLYIMC